VLILFSNISNLYLYCNILIPFFRCPPCKGFTPLYEEMSTKYKDVAFGKIDIDQCQDAALEYEIRAVPTFVIFDGEVAKDKFSGADPGKLEDIVKAL
jgi:thioredoxin 1